MPQHHPAPAVVQRIQNSRYIRAFSVVCSAFMALIYLLRIPGMLGAFADAMKLFRVLLVFAVLACIGYVVVSTVTDVNTPVTDREVMKNGGFSHRPLSRYGYEVLPCVLNPFQQLPTSRAECDPIVPCSIEVRLAQLCGNSVVTDDDTGRKGSVACDKDGNVGNDDNDDNVENADNADNDETATETCSEGADGYARPTDAGDADDADDADDA